MSDHLDFVSVLRPIAVLVFDTMLNLKLREGLPRETYDTQEEQVAGSIGFAGDFNGLLYLHVSAPFALDMASRMLGIPREEISGHEMINDVVGEIANMLAGQFKTQLCDAGWSCAITFPTVIRGHHFHIVRTAGSERRLLHLDSDEQHLLLELIYKPEP